MTPSDSTLNQILDKLNTLGERIASLEARIEAVIGAHDSDLADHEKRIRTLEAMTRDAITQTDLDELEAKRTKQVADALAEADRKRNRGTAYIVAAIAVINTGIAIFTALH